MRRCEMELTKEDYKLVAGILALLCILLVFFLATGGLKQMVIRCPDGYLPITRCEGLGVSCRPITVCVKEVVDRYECATRCFGFYDLSDSISGKLEPNNDENSQNNK